MRTKTLLLCSLLLPTLSLAETPDLESLYKTIQKQQAEIEALQNQTKQQEGHLNQTADLFEQKSTGTSAHIGGYGEIHYSNLNDQAGTANKTEWDFHRFVLMVSKEFSDKTRFFSELELEHSLAGEGKKGEMELEQAYIEHDLSPSQHLKLGLFLVPVGLMNETHEPNTFYGVERNPVENNIVPTTWWEGGLALNGEIGAGFSYDAAVTSGLYVDTATGKYKIRDGRQKVSSARGDDQAFTTRLKYTGVKGLEVGLTMQYQEDLTQGTGSKEIGARLAETHVAYQIDGFALRALYARWDINDVINTVKSGAAVQSGWYLEPSYRINEQWGVFARYNTWDNQADDSSDSAMEQIDLGVNYWIHPNVVVKLDLQDQNPETKGATELDGFNLGAGWSF
jgi:hypothetical protein